MYERYFARKKAEKEMSGMTVGQMQAMSLGMERDRAVIKALDQLTELVKLHRQQLILLGDLINTLGTTTEKKSISNQTPEGGKEEGK